MKSGSPSSTTVSGKRSKLVNLSIADLPSSLLEVIMSLLVFKDNIRASVACKSWLEAALSVRVVEKHPWLLCFQTYDSNLFELRDPLQWKPYTLELPEIADSTVRYSRDGWLLMQRYSSEDEMFFFNPFTRELITLPKFELAFRQISFSFAPTSDSCVVVALSFSNDHVTISSCHPGAAEWISNDFPTKDQMFTNLVYLNERFYCINCYNRTGDGLYSFHPSSRTWNCHATQYSYLDPLDHRTLRGCEKFWYQSVVCLAEKEGELFLMTTSHIGRKPLVYKLVSLRWEEMSTETELDGLTIFASSYNSEGRKSPPSMRNNVYFSRFGYNRKHCLSRLVKGGTIIQLFKGESGLNFVLMEASGSIPRRTF
ncbi:unnamed protein product [Microthlaspi erraticum]|uniref:Uncharacterized protein n=1 Tax=Microthlaspi erraticum TaxID=1685480 RepID=A0A6D2HUM4_9BRAS|nr:unnamed protein product [Microthlaspi erraticum]